MVWLSFYKTYFPALKENAQKQNVVCPFHEDTDPSMSVDLETGLYYCHACKDGGDVIKFYMKQCGCSFTKAKRDIFGNERTPVLTETESEIAHKNLLESKHLQDLLFIKRAWSLDTIKKFKLGWLDEKVLIPIPDSSNKLANIRKYDVLHKTKEKFVGIKGYNQIRIFPEVNMIHETVILFAGEPDTMLADQLGLPAVTFTGGEGNFKESLLVQFKNKKVFVCYDVDDTGRKAASVIAERLCLQAIETKIISLPARLLPVKGDFTDFFLRCIEDKLDFTKEWNDVVANASLIEPAQEPQVEYEKVDFFSSVKEDYYNKSVSFQAIAIGKGISPFLAPRKINISCDFTKGDSCKTCRLSIYGGSYTLNINDSDLLDMIKCSQVTQKAKIKDLVGIDKCNSFKMEFDTQSIEEVFISPIIDTEKIDRQFAVRKCYTKGHDIQLNKTYNFFGKTIADARTQEATHYFVEQVPELTALDKFKLSDEDVFLLKKFQPKLDTVESVDDKVYEIARDLAYNIPELIVGRENLIIAYDLVFHSVLKFKFANSVVEKGWTELLAIGDTRTAKTKTAIKLCRHYKVGEYITLESATLPGLVGGMSQIGRDMTFSWGVLPINDGRLAILDEVNGLSTLDIGNLSSIRDNGVAERTIVGSTRKTASRVRLIWISNPRSNNVRISNYSSGVEAIKELLGRAEDIARLDLAIVVAKEDVETEHMNQLTYKKPEHIHTSEMCHKLVMWAWSRKQNQIRFTSEAEKEVLKYAVEMSEKYSDTIPLVQGSIQRIKLAKLSVALACRLFSTEDGANVIVKPEHVKFVVGFLYSIYDSQYFGYKDYSINRHDENVVSSENEVEVMIGTLKDPLKFATKMLSINMIMFDDLGDFTGLEREHLKYFKSTLVTNNCIKRRKNFFVKTPEFIKMLKKLISIYKNKQAKEAK